MENVGIYIRVSTEEQVNEGTSLQSQKRKLIAYCESQGWTIAGIYADEGISGSTIEKRPQATKMLEDAKKGIINRILILKVDRLCRNTRNLLEIVDLCKKYNVKLSAVEEQIDYTTPTGKMMLTMLGSFAELERATITARMVGGKEQKNRNGYIVHSQWLPFGYKREGDMLVPNPLEVPLFMRIYHMYIDDQLTANEICRRLYAEGIVKNTRKTGAIWKPSVIYKMFRNPVYKGWTRYHRTKGNMISVPAKNVVPILTEEQWDELNAVLEARVSATKSNRHYPKYIYWFGSVMYCSECGRKLSTNYTPAITTSGNKFTYLYYFCKYSKNNDTIIISCTNKGRTIQRKVSDMFLQKIQELGESDVKDKPIVTIDTKPIEKEIESMNTKKKRLLDLYLDGNLDQKTYNEKVMQLDSSIVILQEQIDSIKNEASTSSITEESLAQLRELSKDIVSIWSLMSDQEKRKFVDANVKRIDFNKKEGIVNILWNIK